MSYSEDLEKEIGGAAGGGAYTNAMKLLQQHTNVPPPTGLKSKKALFEAYARYIGTLLSQRLSAGKSEFSRVSLLSQRRYVRVFQSIIELGETQHGLKNKAGYRETEAFVRKLVEKRTINLKTRATQFCALAQTLKSGFLRKNTRPETKKAYRELLRLATLLFLDRIFLESPISLGEVEIKYVNMVRESLLEVDARPASLATSWKGEEWGQNGSIVQIKNVLRGLR